MFNFQVKREMETFTNTTTITIKTITTKHQKENETF